jgi:3-carboxy-cis,cis-muconate cycloisomerase
MSTYETWLASPEMTAAFGDQATVQAMLDFEAALVRAQAAEGVVPEAAATAIAGVCKAELYDVSRIVGAAARAGSLAIPLVGKLTETVALFDADAARFVHRGSTSQDVIDSALVLQTRRGLALLDRDVGRLVAALLGLAQAHGGAPLLGRTLMQPAQVIAFSFKAAGWIAPLVRGRARLHAAGRAALKLQLGGAVGTRAMLGDRADAIARRMADALQLRDAPAWHTQRDELIALGCEVGVLAGGVAKVARDIALLAQGEVAEVAEGAAGGSSAMPHKRNPVAAMAVLAAAQRVPPRVAALLGAMAQEHERGLGNWQSELGEWAGLFIAAHGAVGTLAGAVPALQVDAARMRANIDALHGLVFAEAAAAVLAARIGKARAHTLLEGLSRRVVAEQRPLADVLREALAGDDELGAAIDAGALARAFDIDEAAAPARQRGDAQLAQLRDEAAALDAAAPWAAFVPA